MLQSKHEKKNILITGAGGYIGPILAEYLWTLGYNVHGLDLSFKTPWSKKFLDRAIDGDYGWIDYRVQQYDAVVHLGASSLLGPSMKEPHLYFHNNVVKTQQFLGQLSLCGFDGLFINASSAAVYGDQLSVARITEDSPKQPCNPYGYTKLMVENVIDMLCQVKELNAVSLRFFNVAGAGEFTGSSDDLPHLITALNKAVNTQQTFVVNGSGETYRDYVSVLTVCEAIHKLMVNFFLEKSPYYRSHPKFNVSTGIGTTINEVISIYETEANTKVSVKYGPPRPGDPKVLIGNPYELQTQLGELRQYSVRDIIRSVLAWNITRGELYDYYS